MRIDRIVVQNFSGFELREFTFDPNCLSRIRGGRGMKVEHWYCQAEYPEEQLRYSNLLGACMASDDPDFNQELNVVLNLNEARLRNNRKATLDGP